MAKLSMTGIKKILSIYTFANRKSIIKKSKIVKGIKHLRWYWVSRTLHGSFRAIILKEQKYRTKVPYLYLHMPKGDVNQNTKLFWKISITDNHDSVTPIPTPFAQLWHPRIRPSKQCFTSHDHQYKVSEKVDHMEPQRCISFLLNCFCSTFRFVVNFMVQFCLPFCPFFCLMSIFSFHMWNPESWNKLNHLL